MRHIPEPLRPDFRYCQEIVRANQENFLVGSLLITPVIRPFVHTIYAFARMADDFADLPGRSEAEQMQLLDDWSRRLQLAEAGKPDHPIFRALSYLFETTALPPYLLHHLLVAFRMDVTHKRYETMEQLKEYCRYSANPIGRILLHFTGVQHPEALAQSDAICTALQLTNHWQDIGQDVWHGRPLYLPLEAMNHFGVSEQNILERRFSPAVGELMLSLIEQTRQLYQQGEPLLRQLPWPFNLEIAIAWEAGMTLLQQMEFLGGNTLRHRPTLRMDDWFFCYWRALHRIVGKRPA
ncbi:MAG: squalene synthase HpnC [Magnetococcales bacterium]|nr:squalene synthase HpnC [Magnetococcales bacterium]